MTFRYDINALRAIAVIAVLLFHFFPAWVPSGFAGVDIFFVISGYLMTGIIKSSSSTTMRLVPFYIARAQRIFPSLAFVCLCLLIFSFSGAFNTDNQFALHKHIASSLSFTSNILYWTEAGYFDAIASEKWLLHTWSLSVEWQFYLLYPLFIASCAKLFSRKSLRLCVVLATITSALFGIFASYYSPNLAYYALPTRAWALMLGGLAYFYPQPFFSRPPPISACTPTNEPKKPSSTGLLSRRAISQIGLLCIFLSLWIFDAQTPWPGTASLLPVIGSYLVIVANADTTAWIKSQLIQAIGRWSYSIYLWHWPLFVLAVFLDLNSLPMLAGFALLSIIIGGLSYRFIESQRTLGVGLWGLLLVASTLFAWQEQQQIQAQKQHYHVSPTLNTSICQGFDAEVCKQYGQDDELMFVLWGDSHSLNLRNYLAFKGYKFAAFSTIGCPPIQGVNRVDNTWSARHCQSGINDQIFERLQRFAQTHPNVPHNLMMIGRWNIYRYGWHKNRQLQADTHFICRRSDCAITESSANHSAKTLEMTLTHTIKHLTSHKQNTKANWRVLLLYGEPQLPVRGVDFRNKASQQLTFTEHQQSQKENSTFFTSLATQEANLRCIDYSPWLFMNKQLTVTVENHLIFKDDNHLLERGWQHIDQQLQQQIQLWLESIHHS